MNVRKEYKFALPTSLGLLFGVLTGSLLFYLIIGTVLGLVWGYSDQMLMTTTPSRTRSPRSAKSVKKASRKTSHRKKK